MIFSLAFQSHFDFRYLDDIICVVLGRVDGVISVVESSFDLANELLVVYFQHIWDLFDQVENVGEWQSLAFYYKFVIFSPKVFEFFVCLVFIIENKIFFLSFSGLALYFWNMIIQVLLPDIDPLVFFAEYN